MVMQVNRYSCLGSQSQREPQRKKEHVFRARASGVQRGIVSAQWRRVRTAPRTCCVSTWPVRLGDSTRYFRPPTALCPPPTALSRPHARPVPHHLRTSTSTSAAHKADDAPIAAGFDLDAAPRGRRVPPIKNGPWEGRAREESRKEGKKENQIAQTKPNRIPTQIESTKDRNRRRTKKQNAPKHRHRNRMVHDVLPVVRVALLEREHEDLGEHRARRELADIACLWRTPQNATECLRRPREGATGRNGSARDMGRARSGGARTRARAARGETAQRSHATGLPAFGPEEALAVVEAGARESAGGVGEGGLKARWCEVVGMQRGEGGNELEARGWLGSGGGDHRGGVVVGVEEERWQ
ncbi:hypothetical protein DFH09DRAFT_1084387 [Mycena vulgaris]|nr:hypothetical protein DFH09DRAFT_1084387 [Mycena vulgaris]